MIQTIEHIKTLIYNHHLTASLSKLYLTHQTMATVLRSVHPSVEHETTSSNTCPRSNSTQFQPAWMEASWFLEWTCHKFSKSAASVKIHINISNISNISINGALFDMPLSSPCSPSSIKWMYNWRCVNIFNCLHTGHLQSFSYLSVLRRRNVVSMGNHVVNYDGVVKSPEKSPIL